MGFNIAKTNKKRVVIIGGGFGGLKLANKLKGSNFQVVLIDKNNFHQFPPLLYQVASSGLEPGSIIFPFRKIFQKQKDFYFRMAEVKAIIAERNLIETSIGELTYDYLVIASGTITNFFGNKTIEEKALPMKTIQEALELRNTLLSNFEKATICTNPPPKVKSAVIRLVRNQRTSLGCDEALFKTVVKTGFNQRRKTLRNSLKPLIRSKADRMGWSEEQVAEFVADPVFELRR